MLHFFDDYLHGKNFRYWLILSRKVDDQRILQSYWVRGTDGHMQTKVASEMLPFFDDYLNGKNLRDWLILSRDIDDQRMLQSDQQRAF